MKNKNIRAKLRQHNLSGHTEESLRAIEEKAEQNRSSEAEISFNITPEEEELRKSILNINKAADTNKLTNQSKNETLTRFDVNELERANAENQREIQFLLEKTKNFLKGKESSMISNGDPESSIFVKIPVTSQKPEKSGKNTVDEDRVSAKQQYNNTERFQKKKNLDNKEMENVEELPLEYTTIRKVSKDDRYSLKENSLINENGYNINSINQRLLEKIKVIKNLEKELKEKNGLVQRLNSKIDKLNLEISKLNEKLSSEKGSQIKSENLELQKRLKGMEQDINEKNKIFEEVVGEYKVRLEKMIAANNSTMEKLKELENINRNLVQSNQSFENKFREFKTNYEKELKERKANEEKASTIISNFKQFLKLLFNYKNSLKDYSQTHKDLFEKIDRFLAPEKNTDYPLSELQRNYLLESNMTNSYYHEEEDR